MLCKAEGSALACTAALPPAFAFAAFAAAVAVSMDEKAPPEVGLPGRRSRSKWLSMSPRHFAPLPVYSAERRKRPLQSRRYVTLYL